MMVENSKLTGTIFRQVGTMAVLALLFRNVGVGRSIVRGGEECVMKRGIQVRSRKRAEDSAFGDLFIIVVTLIIVVVIGTGGFVGSCIVMDTLMTAGEKVARRS